MISEIIDKLLEWLDKLIKRGEYKPQPPTFTIYETI